MIFCQNHWSLLHNVGSTISCFLFKYIIPSNTVRSCEEILKIAGINLLIGTSYFQVLLQHHEEEEEANIIEEQILEEQILEEHIMEEQIMEEQVISGEIYSGVHIHL
jgi:hypothetical protein